MLSTRLVHLIESHWEEIAARLIRSIKSHPDLKQFGKCPEHDLRRWCQNILKNLGELLSASKDQDVERQFQLLGKMRFEEKVPLHEAVLRLILLKGHILDYIHGHGFPMTAVELYSEEELELRIGRFFDACVYHIVRGYEDAMRVAERVAS